MGVIDKEPLKDRHDATPRLRACAYMFYYKLQYVKRHRPLRKSVRKLHPRSCDKRRSQRRLIAITGRTGTAGPGRGAPVALGGPWEHSATRPSGAKPAMFATTISHIYSRPRDARTPATCDNFPSTAGHV